MIDPLLSVSLVHCASYPLANSPYIPSLSDLRLPIWDALQAGCKLRRHARHLHLQCHSL